MKYCINCGSKLKEDDKYCDKCGSPTRIVIEKNKEIKKQEKENRKDKTLLSLGIFLVVFSSILFAFISWKNLSDLFKLLFVCFESILFFLLSFISKKMNNKLSFRMCYAIGVILLPIIIYLFNYYNYTSLYFKEGAGLYIYLSIISFICFILSIISYKITRSSFYNLTNYFSIIFLADFILSIFKIPDDDIICDIVISIITLIYNILINKNIIFKGKNSITNFFISFILIICIVTLPISSLDLYKNGDINGLYKIELLIVNILLTINLYVKELDKKSIIKYITPVLIMSMFSVYFRIILDGSILLVLILLTSILIYLISLYKNNEGIKVTSLIILFLTIFLIIGFSSSIYKALLINSAVILVFSISMYKIENTKSISNLFGILIPISIYFIIYSIFRLTLNLTVCEILLISSIIMYVIYLILKNNKSKLSNIFEVFYIIFLVISTIRIGDYNSFRIVILLNTIVWLFYYIMNIVVNKSGLKYLFLLGTIISLIILFGFMHIEFFYILIGIIFILFLSSELDNDKYNLYLIFGSILTLFILVFDFTRYNIFSLLAGTLLYIYSYLKIKKLNINIFRIIYALFGFIFIYKLVGALIVPSMIVGIITLLIYVFILIVMYLSESEKNSAILLYSFMILLPYFIIMSNLNIYEDIKNNVVFLPFIIYTLVIGEFIKFSNVKTKQILIFIIILFFSLSSISSNIYMQIFNIVLSVIYLAYSIIKKYDLILYFSIIYLLITILISISNIFSNMIIVLILLFIGIGLVIYTFIKETKKK